MTDRRFMAVPDEIVERMARDILAARRDRPGVALVDLTDYGWTAAQAARYASRAHAMANRADFACEDAVRRGAEEEDARPTPMLAATIAPADADAVARRLADEVEALGLPSHRVTPFARAARTVATPAEPSAAPSLDWNDAVRRLEAAGVVVEPEFCIEFAVLWIGRRGGPSLEVRHGRVDAGAVEDLITSMTTGSEGDAA